MQQLHMSNVSPFLLMPFTGLNECLTTLLIPNVTTGELGPMRDHFLTVADEAKKHLQGAKGDLLHTERPENSHCKH